MSPLHRQQYVDFRVVVYRLNVSGQSSVVGPNGPLNFSTIFNTDFGDDVYSDLSLLLTSGGTNGNFQKFLNEYYAAIEEVLSGAGADAVDLQNAGLYQEIDITPLVSSATNHIGLYDINHCSLSMLDASLASFTGTELDRYRHKKPLLSELQGFRLREFDLVRVFAYSGVDESQDDKLAALAKRFAGSLGSRFIMSPVFTGLVNKIVRGNDVGGTAYMKADLLGVERIFAQSTTVVNQATADQIVAALPTIPALQNAFSALDPRFAGMGADAVIIDIFSMYLAPSFLISADGSVQLGVPDVSYLFKHKMFNSAGAAKLIPMIPTIILLHILKKKYGEPFLMFDDRVEPTTVDVSGSGALTVATESVSKDAMLTPYLLRVRKSFALYSGQYEPASGIFDTIKQTTYMEFFEDRTGEFHFRFPRYNTVNCMAYIDPDDVISASHEKSDSAIFTAEMAQLQAPFAGSLQVPPLLYVDKLSVLKFGLRKPQTVENPNATTPDFASALAEFSRDYHSMKDSRTAHVTKLGDTSLNVGQMALFKIKRDSGTSSSPASGSSESGDDVLAGYITTIDETLSVGGSYTQTLGLSFVRPAAQATGKFIVKGTGTAWDIVNNMPEQIAQRLASRLPGPSDIAKFQTSPADTSSFLYDLNYTHRSMTGAIFRQILTPLNLADLSASFPGMKAAAELEAFGTGKPVQNTKAHIAAALKAKNAVVVSAKKDIATNAVLNAILTDFILKAALAPSDVTYINLKIFGDRLAASYASIIAAYVDGQKLRSSYANVTVQTSSGPTTLGDITLNASHIFLSTNWDSFKKIVGYLYDSAPTAPGIGFSKSLESLWSTYFQNPSNAVLSSGELSKAREVFSDFMSIANGIVKSNSVAITSGSPRLSGAFAETKSLLLAQANSTINPVSTTANTPAAIPPFVASAQQGAGIPTDGIYLLI